MTKTEFLARLDKSLAALSREDRERSVRYFDEIIADRVEEGAKEEDAIADLGSIEEIAAELLSESEEGYTAAKPKNGRYLKGYPLWLVVLLAVLAAPVWLPLGITLAVVAFCLYLVPWIFVLSLFCVVVGLIVGGAGGVILSFLILPVSGVYNGMLLLGLALVCCGLGLLLLFPALAACKGLVKATAWCYRKLKEKGKGRKS